MRLFTIVCLFFCCSSCWTKVKPNPPTIVQKKVWGNKPIYTSQVQAKQIAYLDTALPVMVPGNIYVKGNIIFQLEIGKGVHVIDNSISSQAHRIGFITINGSSQISIKDNFLYANSYDDLVVIDISNTNTVTEVKRVAGALPEGRHNYFYMQPVESGYYECPQYDSVVVGWVKDSVWNTCYKD